MTVYFLPIFFKIIPLYANIFMGYLVGRWLQASREMIARLLFFFMTPILIFNGIIHTDLNPSLLLLPLITFLISSLLCLLFYNISSRIWQNDTKNLIAYSAGVGNTGYFGLPLAILLFNDQGEGTYLMSLLGLALYENSVGYYVLAHGSYTTFECIKKLLKLPSLYAFFSALSLNLLQIPISPLFNEYAGYVKGAYTILGMMIIGMGISGMQSFKLDYKYIGMTFLAKFIFWPAAVMMIIFLDLNFFKLLNEMIYKVLILISIVPLAANTVVLATLFKYQPEKAATAVILSTLFALIYVPLMVVCFIH